MSVKVVAGTLCGAFLTLVPAHATAQQATPTKPAGMTREQFMPRETAKLLRLDTDRDGRISPTEYGMRKVPNPAKLPKRFKRMDTDADGFLSAAEVAAHAGVEFTHLDKDGDGVVTREEQHARKKTRAEPASN